LHYFDLLYFGAAVLTQKPSLSPCPVMVVVHFTLYAAKEFSRAGDVLFRKSSENSSVSRYGI